MRVSASFRNTVNAIPEQLAVILNNAERLANGEDSYFVKLRRLY